jgi:flavin reductase
VPEARGRTARSVSAEDFRRAMGRFTTGVTVVTTVVDDRLHGMTANAFASVSLDPLLVLVCVDRESGLHDLLPRSKVFAVTVLGSQQEDLSVWFADRDRPSGTAQFEGVHWSPAPVSGCPVLRGGLAFLDCRVTEIHAGGDHSIFLGEVLDVGELEATEPLLYYDGGYHRLAELER